MVRPERMEAPERISLGDLASMGSVKPSGEMLHWTGDFMHGPLNYVQPLSSCEHQARVFLDVRKRKQNVQNSAQEKPLKPILLFALVLPLY